MEKFRLEQCCGHIAAKCHTTHNLSIQGGVLWCRACGAYTSRQPRSLKLPCPRKPPSEAAANVKARLARGLPPTTAEYLTAASIAVSGSGMQGAPLHSTSTTTPTAYALRSGSGTRAVSAPLPRTAMAGMRDPQANSNAELARNHTDAAENARSTNLGEGRPDATNRAATAHLSSRYRVLDQRRGLASEQHEREDFAPADAQETSETRPHRRRITGKQSADPSVVAQM